MGIGATARQANYISAVPFICGIIGILVFGHWADKHPDRRRQLLILALSISALGLAAAGLVGANMISVVLLGLAAVGIYGVKGPFWPLPSSRLRPLASIFA